MVKIPQKVVRNDSYILREKGGPYADALVVKLPKDPERRKAVFEVCAKEIRNEGFNYPEREIRNEIIFLWWD